MHKILVLAAAGSVLLGVTGSNAAELLSPPAAPAARTAAVTTSAPPSGVSQVPAKGPPILLEAGKGTLIRLPRPAATVFIANPDVADVQVKSPSMIYVNAKTPGETVLYAVDADDNVLLNAPIRVEHDVSRLRESLHALIPGENVAVESVDGSLVLKGNVSTALRAEKANALATSIANEAKGKVVNQLSVATPNQVNLQVKIAEVDRTVLKALGVNWSKLNGNTTFATSNPTTGGQIAVQNRIDFTPTVIDAQHVSLRVRPEASQLTNTGAVSVPITANNTVTIPALTVRRAETTVELGSGQSFALAGLLQHTLEQDISKVPGLGDIPILGQLFRSQRFQKNETELVIIVTPYLVKPASTVAALQSPTDGFVTPHDVQTIINGATYRQTLPAGEKVRVAPGAQGLVGPVGFRLD